MAAPVQEVLSELKRLGNDATKRTWLRHGAQEPVFGVRIGDMKVLLKRIKKDHDLAIDLFDTGVADAMYFAAFLVDDAKMSKRDLQRWAKQAKWQMISDYTVAWCAAESRFGWELALEWIDSKHHHVACAGWSTLSNLVSIKPDDELDFAALRQLLDRVAASIHNAPNRVRYTMNCFVIAVGSYVRPLTAAALTVASKIGKVHVDVGDTECKVPDAATTIQHIKKLGRLGKKRKMARC